MDLTGGRVVHAVQGQRARYRPVRSRLLSGHEPLEVAAAFRARLGLEELYVADLDAIAGGPGQDALIADLAAGSRVAVDAGSGDAAAVGRLRDLGVQRVVVGTETLVDATTLGALLAEVAPLPLVLSVDLVAGRVLSADPVLADLHPLDVLSRLSSCGVREAIVLDLARVGTGGGPPLALIAAICQRFPTLEVLAGGGVRHVGDLRALQAAGARGALVGTALHSGAIGPRELRALR
jgi:phosphoribosylformimino-5-aminoimidazole carboxamide ribotide isomerase